MARPPPPPPQCEEKLGSLVFQLAKNFILFVLMVIACNGLHFALKPYSQPRITSDIFVGLVMGNISFLRDLYNQFNIAFGFIIDVGMMCYMFALGIEMDPYALFKRPTRDAQVAYAGIISTFLLSHLLSHFLSSYIFYFPAQQKREITLSMSTLLSSTASPVLTHLITQLKIGKSDIGKVVIAAGMHSDFICSLLLSLGYIALPINSYCNSVDHFKHSATSITMFIGVLLQTLVTASLSPLVMKWINNENPEGKPMKGSHLVLALAFMVIMCASSTMCNYSPILSAFMTGICLPREGRVSRWVITKINYLLTTIFFPIFFLWMGYSADFKESEPRNYKTWAQLLFLIGVVIVGKVVGTVIYGVAMLGFNWPESVAIGMLLTIKGHFHLYLAIKLLGCGIGTTTTIAMVITTFLTVVPAPAIVKHIIKRARKRAPTHRMSLQLLDQSSELRILMCLHGLDNVPASINLMEISRGKADPDIGVHVTDMIELADEIAATIERGDGIHTTTLQDKTVIEMRDQVTSSFKAYVDGDGHGISLNRTVVVSTINNMAQDICILAEDLMIPLIILPFHRSQCKDGKLDGGNQGFRYVNKKLLKSAPCTVGILVDRGLGSLEKISRSQVSINVATIFIGGKDDREALAYASRVAQHPGVKLTVIRLLVDTSAETSSSAARKADCRVSLPEQEEEMVQDDECFAQVYEEHIVGGRISYTEKHLANAAETFATLRSFEGQYSLVIVGRDGGVNSILTKGMNDWQQCPEMGPIGDVLSGPDFATTMSVLVIRQHNNIKGELEGLDDEFSIM
ncbi:hypothetical protein RIF29_32752 [Crotalaria pallida]|uniref:Cation/H+ exchanger domain-containing protein n=1 Tax=Crotalaria pallida TaxID=3830 RepID=A0AAN9HXV9_CROPI